MLMANSACSLALDGGLLFWRLSRRAMGRQCALDPFRQNSRGPVTILIFTSIRTISRPPSHWPAGRTVGEWEVFLSCGEEE